MESINVRNKKMIKERSSSKQTSETIISHVAEENISNTQNIPKDLKRRPTKHVIDLCKKTSPSVNNKAAFKSGKTSASVCDDISTTNMATNSALSTTSSFFNSETNQNKIASSEQMFASTDLIDNEHTTSVPIDGVLPSNTSISMQVRNSSELMTTSKMSSSAFYEVFEQSQTKSGISSSANIKTNEVTSLLSNPQPQQTYVKSVATNDETYTPTIKSSALSEFERLSQRTNVGVTKITNKRSAESVSTSNLSKITAEPINKKSQQQSKEHTKEIMKSKATITTNQKAENTDNIQHQRVFNRRIVEPNTTKTEYYDDKTKTWSTLTEKTFKNKKKPTLIRYFSKEPNGSSRWIYKKKVYDQHFNKWKVVDEKIVDSNCTDAIYPDIIDDVMNTTTTTYTTKLYNSETGKWEIVDEKSFVDSQAYVPHDIACEIEKDNTDVANITTTSEVTKVCTEICI